MKLRPINKWTAKRCLVCQKILRSHNKSLLCNKHLQDRIRKENQDKNNETGEIKMIETKQQRRNRLMRVYNKKYRNSHKEQLSAYHKKYNLEHRKENRQKSMEYYYKKRDKILQNQRDYYNQKKKDPVFRELKNLSSRLKNKRIKGNQNKLARKRKIERAYYQKIKNKPEYKIKRKLISSKRWFRLKSDPVKYAKEKERDRLRRIKKKLKGGSYEKRNNNYNKENNKR